MQLRCVASRLTRFCSRNATTASKDLSKSTADAAVQDSERQHELFIAKDVPLSRESYQKYMEECRAGDSRVLNFPESNADLHLVSVSTVAPFSATDVYKMLNRLKPSLIMLQVRPDQFLKSEVRFDPKDDEEAYIQQLMHSPEKVLPSWETYQRVKTDLLCSGILIGEQRSWKSEAEEDFSHRERLNEELIATASMWAARNQSTPILLADLPEQVYLPHVANSLSLHELREIFRLTCNRRGYAEEDKPVNLFGSMIRAFPDIFLYLTDRYIAAIVRAMLKSRARPIPESWVLFCGHGQTRSLPQYIAREDYTYKLSECMKVPERFSTILRRESVEMLIEKIAMLELLHNSHITVGKSEEIEQLLSKRNVEWIKREVIKDLGTDAVSSKLRLFMGLVNECIEERNRQIRLGVKRRSAEYKSVLLNKLPL